MGSRSIRVPRADEIRASIRQRQRDAAESMVKSGNEVTRAMGERLLAKLDAKEAGDA